MLLGGGAALDMEPHRRHASRRWLRRREPPAITASGGSLDATEATLFQLGRALQGLTLDEVRHAIRRALTTRPVLDQESIPTLLEEKRMLVNRTGMIEYIPSETTI